MTTPTVRRQRRKKVVEPVSYYVLPIQSWKWDYSFGVNNSRIWPDEAYSDYRHLIVRGQLEHPQAIAGQQTELSFVPSGDLLQPIQPSREKPAAVGSIYKGRASQVLGGILSMPEDVPPSLLPMLIGGRLRFVLLIGSKLRRWSAQIQSYSFLEEVTEDDLPMGE